MKIMIIESGNTKQSPFTGNMIMYIESTIIRMKRVQLRNKSHSSTLITRLESVLVLGCLGGSVG